MPELSRQQENEQKTHNRAPALDAVEFVDVKFQNSFLEHTIYRGIPNRERERAWLDLWNFGPINIPFERLDVLNKSRDGNWQRATPEDGGGIVGSLEVFHYIHCLDIIRQYTYRDETHVDHCINSLRVFLQCKVDITPYLNVIAPETLLGLDVDFNTQHKCIDFDKIRSWARKHELDTTKYQRTPHR
ncbi:hypothetical protein F5Y19DRAFT_465573 [Xylariaceae sp. FL1651]|nr:hypothetical protein F5Y19DRAFT_465573 [Xylariaceae sp. FL1651]